MNDFKKMDIKAKEDRLERKVVEVLREEIGVEVGEEFDVYENGVKRWTCKFQENGHLARYKRGGFEESFIWKYWIFLFDKYVFKRKLFVPEYGEDYFFLATEYDKSKGLNFRALQSTWIDSSIDDGMLAVGNIFRTEEEALKRRDELLEKLGKLRKGEE